ncbi:hypothetical protein [Novipirellula artificiosorum]|uniref:Uncharacterized protein n=1 Tax=Novipirellula artificiosorum TaxID=2528016 RepID=A0A5C6E427_9BACT|nr:hypothetical protein [Novipirellula artificiosorum]TWU41969.1 hypothetical protein Poly41_02650 [Novipirellula artificiosorum]
MVHPLIQKPQFGLMLSLWVISFAGCTTLNLPGFNLSPDGTKYVSSGAGGEFNGFDETMTETIYQKVRQAQAENAIVFQVGGNEDACKVLPLPPEGKSVFVSTLLTQTGVLNKIGGVDVTLYRSSPQSIGGVRMEVEMAEGGRIVRPESDYALRPGDRVFIERALGTKVGGLLNTALGF